MENVSRFGHVVMLGPTTAGKSTLLRIMAGLQNPDSGERTLLKGAVARFLEEMGIHDPLLDIAKQLEEVALKDDFFIARKLYPNIDFYSGIIYRAMGIPTEMFTVLFAIGRMPGWIAHFLEMRQDPDLRIQRPRQIYTGETLREYNG